MAGMRKIKFEVEKGWPTPKPEDAGNQWQIESKGYRKVKVVNKKGHEPHADYTGDEGFGPGWGPARAGWKKGTIGGPAPEARKSGYEPVMSGGGIGKIESKWDWGVHSDGIFDIKSGVMAFEITSGGTGLFHPECSGGSGHEPFQYRISNKIIWI